MKLIDEYLDELYKKYNNKSTIELKQEMRYHLIESANEFKLDGLDEKEACKKAIERFDDGTEMQYELHNVIKELSSSLDRHKSIVIGTRKVLVCISVIAFLISGLMWYYNDNLQNSRHNLGKDFDREIKQLAEKHDMTKIDEYKLELEKILDEDKYSEVKALRLYVVDMEDGNTSLSSSRLNANMIYEKEVDYDNISNFTQHLGYNGKDFLDKNGNIVNPDIFLEYFFYFESEILVPVTFIVGILSIIGYSILKFKICLIKSNN
ncbi:permease prefix domain 1-containing protein [Clostridioides difficile]